LFMFSAGRRYAPLTSAPNLINSVA
jgi:hypothetical protein